MIVSSQEKASELRRVPKWTSVTTFATRYEKGYRLESTVLLKKGKRIVPGESILVARTGKVSVGCLYVVGAVHAKPFPPRTNGIKQAITGCFADFDGDGNFDHFSASGNLYNRQKRSKYKPIEAVAYTEAAEMPPTGELAVYFLNDNPAGEVVFATCAKIDDVALSSCLYPSTKIKKNSFPARFSMLGVEFQVDDYADQHVVISQLTEVKNFSFQILGI